MNIKNINQCEYTISDYKLSNILKNDYLIFDLEATGLNTKKDYIIQFGAVLLENGKLNKTKKFISYVNSPKKISKFITKLTSINNKHIANAPTIEEVIKPLWDKYSNYIWVAQCGFEFDFKLLKRQLSKTKNIQFEPKITDTKLMYSYLYKSDKKIPSTDYLLNKYNINIKNLKRHNALNDSIIVSKILIEILDEFKKNNLDNIVITKSFKIKKMII